MPRLEEIHANLGGRLQEAKEQGWLGEVAAIEATLAAAAQKLQARTHSIAELRTFGGWSCDCGPGGLTANQVLGLACLFCRDVTGPACAQPPWGGEAVREFRLPGQGQFDEAPDLRLCVRLGREQDPHAQLAADFVRAHAMRRQRAWRLVIPVPAQRHRNRRPRSPDVTIRLHHQDRFMSKGLAHNPSMRASARSTDPSLSVSPRSGTVSIR
jgi:hypothetical protein